MLVRPATALAALVVDLNSLRTAHGFQPGVASNSERPDPASFNAGLPGLDKALWDYVIVHELLHLFVPNQSRHWKSLMRAHLGNYESMEAGLARHG